VRVKTLLPGSLALRFPPLQRRGFGHASWSTAWRCRSACCAPQTSRRAAWLALGSWNCTALTRPLQLGAVFGSGIQTYFRLLRWLCIVTTVSACTTYATNCGIALAASADPRLSSPTGVQRIARVTLWPLQMLVDPTTGAASSSFGPTGRAAQSDKRAAVLAMSVLDLAAVLGLFLGLAVFRRREDRIGRASNLATITVDDYSLQLYGFPRVPLQAEEIAQYLQEAVPELEGCVAEVTVARAYGEYLERVYAAEALEEELEELDALVAATGRPAPAAKRRALEEQAAKLRGELATMDEASLVAVCAFVTFDTVAARDTCAAAFPGGALRAALPMLAPVGLPRFRGQHVLRSSHSGDPADVFWENMHYSAAARARRALLSGLCAFTLLLITTSLVVGAKSFDNTLPPYVECSTATLPGGPLPCDALFRLGNATSDADPARTQITRILSDANAANCDVYLSSADQFIPNLASMAPIREGSMDAARDPLAVKCGAAACYGCYCSTALDSAAEWNANKSGLRAFCSEYWSKKVSAWALKGVSIVSVITVNIAFLVVLPKFTRLEKLATRGEHDAANVRKVFAAQFFNAFVVVSARHARLGAPRPLRRACLTHATLLRRRWRCMPTSPSWSSSLWCSKAPTPTFLRLGINQSAAPCSSPCARSWCSRRRSRSSLRSGITGAARAWRGCARSARSTISWWDPPGSCHTGWPR